MVTSLSSTTPLRSLECMPLQKELKNYFGQLLVSSRPNNKTTRKRLTGIGESLTSEEAIDHLRSDEEQKKKKEEEKLERKRKREEKKKEKENKKKKKQKDAGSKKNKSTNNQKASSSREQSRAMCLECQMYYDMDDGEEQWIEWEKCFNWYHMTCVGIDETNDQAHVDFVCSSCV